jgi:hypothetical protein
MLRIRGLIRNQERATITRNQPDGGREMHTETMVHVIQKSWPPNRADVVWVRFSNSAVQRRSVDVFDGRLPIDSVWTAITYSILEHLQETL